MSEFVHRPTKCGVLVSYSPPALLDVALLVSNPDDMGARLPGAGPQGWGARRVLPREDSTFVMFPPASGSLVGGAGPD